MIIKKMMTAAGMLFAVSFIISADASAQLMMEESRVKKEVSPGATIVDTMAIHNMSANTMEITIYWEDFVYIPPFTGKKKFLPAGSTDRSLAKSISFFPRKVTLAPGARQEINYTIAMPKDAYGGYYGVLFFEQGANRDPKHVGVSIVTRVGSLFFIETGNRDKSAQLKDVQLSDEALVGQVVNEGNVVLFPQGIYYVLDRSGVVVHRGEVEKRYLPPENTFDFVLPLNDALPTGLSTMVLTFDLQDGDSLVREIDFRKEPASGIRIIAIRD